MAVLSTNLLARQAHDLGDLIASLPLSVAPDYHYARCAELLEQLAVALDLLSESQLA